MLALENKYFRIINSVKGSINLAAAYYARKNYN